MVSPRAAPVVAARWLDWAALPEGARVDPARPGGRGRAVSSRPAVERGAQRRHRWRRRSTGVAGSTGGAAGSTGGAPGSAGGVWARRVAQVRAARRAVRAGRPEPLARARRAQVAAAPAVASSPQPSAFKRTGPFLSATCGGGNGCHVIDSASTTANGGYDHGYDWITAGAHPSSCPETPTPKRFQIVMAVIAAADPPSCSKSRLMPPQDETGANLRAPLTSCQVATLKAWLDEPLVTQAHRVDAPTRPERRLPMPPFN